MYESDFPLESGGGMIEALGMFFWMFSVAIYVYVAYTQFVCAKKCGNESNAYWAFLPVVNIVLLCQMASKPIWWCLLMFVPVVNIVIFAMIGIEIAKKCGLGAFWGIMTLVPFINFIALGMMAWGKGSGPVSSSGYSSSPEQQRSRQPVG